MATPLHRSAPTRLGAALRRYGVKTTRALQVPGLGPSGQVLATRFGTQEHFAFRDHFAVQRRDWTPVAQGQPPVALGDGVEVIEYNRWKTGEELDLAHSLSDHRGPKVLQITTVCDGRQFTSEEVTLLHPERPLTLSLTELTRKEVTPDAVLSLAEKRVYQQITCALGEARIFQADGTAYRIEGVSLSAIPQAVQEALLLSARIYAEAPESSSDDFKIRQNGQDIHFAIDGNTIRVSPRARFSGEDFSIEIKQCHQEWSIH